MRITSANAFESSVSNLQRRQQALGEAQQQLTSGKRVLKPSDDPAAAAAAERALASSQRIDAAQRALGASRNVMLMAESALSDAGNLLQMAREFVIGAGNGGYSDAERKTLAESLRGVRDDLLAVANRGDGSGRYLFGGQGMDTPPFVKQLDVVSPVAGLMGGQSQAASGEVSPLSMDGLAVWVQAPDASSPSGTTSVFETLEKTIAELLTPGRSKDQVAQTVSAGIAGIDTVQENLGAWRARAGEALNRIDGIGQRLGQGKLDAERQLSEAEDLDMLQAISDFQSRQSGYDAALKTYSIVQRMSLFDYVR